MTGPIWRISLALIFIPVLPLSAQESGSTSRSVGDSGGGASIVAPKQPAPQVEVVTYIALTELREWKNYKDIKIEARLLAFSAPEEGKTGPVEVIKDGKVRFLVEKTRAVFDVALEKMSEEDKALILKIAEQAKAGPPKVAPEPKPEAPTPEATES